MAGASYPVPVAFDPLAAGRDPSAGKTAQGPPAIGSNGVEREPQSAIRGAWPHVYGAEAWAMFLANIYALF
mgnify:FL=1